MTRIACSPASVSSAPERRRERPRQQAALPGRELRAQVDDLDLGRAPRPGARAGRRGRSVAVARPAHALDRGRRRAEDDAPRRPARPSRIADVAGLEPGRPVALVRRVVLLVDDDQPDVGERREDRQPRPDHDVDVAAPDPPPLVGALAVRRARSGRARPGRRGRRAAGRRAAARARSRGRGRAPGGRARATRRCAST